MENQQEDSAMHRGWLSDELLDLVLDSYRAEMAKENLTFIEDDYARGKAALDYRLNAEQKKILSDIEVSCRKNLAWAMRFGFCRGLYSGFQTEFTPESAESYYRLVDDELMTMPQMLRYPEYSDGHIRVQQLCELLYGQLDDYTQEHLTSVESAWDERLSGVLRHAFYMGRQQAFAIVCEIKGGKSGKIIRMKE